MRPVLILLVLLAAAVQAAPLAVLTSREAHVPGDPVQITVIAPPNTQINLTVQGPVTATILLTAGPDGAVSHTLDTAGWPPGEYMVKAAAADGATATSKLTLYRPDQVAETTIRTVDPEGTPVKATIVLDGANYQTPITLKLPKGPHRVQAVYMGQVVADTTINVDGNPVKTIACALYTLTVRVKDPLGLPSPNTQVTLARRAQLIGQHKVEAVTGPNGTAVFPHIPPGTYTLQAGEALKTVTVTADTEETLTVPPTPLTNALLAVTAAAALILLIATGTLKIRITRVE